MDQLTEIAETIVQQVKNARADGSCINTRAQIDFIERGEELVREASEPRYSSDGALSALSAQVSSSLATVSAMPTCPGLAAPSSERLSLVALGIGAGVDASASNDSVAIGQIAARAAVDSPYSTSVGNAAGEGITDAPSIVAIGASAARDLKGGEFAIMIGGSTGYEASDVDYSTFMGYAAGRFVKGNHYSFQAGYAAGEYSNNSHSSVLIGTFAGYESWDSPRSVMLGNDAGEYSGGSPSSVFVGDNAGKNAKNAVNSVYLGRWAGGWSNDTKDVILIGSGVNAAPGVENAIGIGRGANPTHSNTWHIPEEIMVGVGTQEPTAQLDITRDVRLRAMPSGVLVTDDEGNVSASDALAAALAKIDALEERIARLEAKLGG